MYVYVYSIPAYFSILFVLSCPIEERLIILFLSCSHRQSNTVMIIFDHRKSEKEEEENGNRMHIWIWYVVQEWIWQSTWTCPRSSINFSLTWKYVSECFNSLLFSFKFIQIMKDNDQCICVCVFYCNKLSIWYLRELNDCFDGSRW